MKMESVNSKLGLSKKLKKPVLTSFKKALASGSSISKAKAKKGVKGVQTKALQRGKGAKKRPQRGTMYIGHLPYGFFEEQIREYFEQFGVVTGVCLPRSKRTARPQGHAFVRFLDKEVAQVAAQTMNNYLMTNRILEAHLIPPHRTLNLAFINKNNAPITPETCTVAKNRKEFVSNKNSTHSNLQHEQMIEEELKKLEKTQKKLTGLGLPKVEL